MYEISFSLSAPSSAIGKCRPRPRNSACCFFANASAHAMTCGSSASAPWIAAGRWRSAPSHFASSPAVSRPRTLASAQREQEVRDELRGERLGRRHADFGAGARQELEHRLPHHRARGDVADGERARMPERLRVLQRRKRVRGFARLRDHDHQRASGAARCRDSGTRSRSRPSTECRRASRSTASRPGSSSSSCRTRGSAPSRRRGTRRRPRRRRARGRRPRRPRACPPRRAAARRSPSA